MLGNRKTAFLSQLIAMHMWQRVIARVKLSSPLMKVWTGGGRRAILFAFPTPAAIERVDGGSGDNVYLASRRLQSKLGQSSLAQRDFRVLCAVCCL